MRGVVTDGVTWFVGQSVCMSVTIVSRANMTEPIELVYGMWTQVGPSNHVLDGVQFPMGMHNFEGRGASHCKV